MQKEKSEIYRDWLRDWVRFITHAPRGISRHYAVLIEAKLRARFVERLWLAAKFYYWNNYPVDPRELWANWLDDNK
jgi:hypothetical protein